MERSCAWCTSKNIAFECAQLCGTVYCSQKCGDNHVTWLGDPHTYHPYATLVSLDPEIHLFDYRKYYRLDEIQDTLHLLGNGRSIAVVENKDLIRLNVVEWLAGPIYRMKTHTILRDGGSTGRFSHADMVCYLINGVYVPSKSFLGGVCPFAVVKLYSLDLLDDVFGTVLILQTLVYAARSAPIINRSGSLTYIEAGGIFRDGEYVKSGYVPWKLEELHTLYTTLEMYDSIIIISAGNDSSRPVGHIKDMETYFFNQVARELPKLFERMLIVGNFKPLDTPTLEKHERTSVLEPGEIVSRTAGIVANHFVLVAGTDIYAPGGYQGKMVSDSGSSQATPIMSGLLTLFQEHHTFPTYKVMLAEFKQNYTKYAGDRELFGLGVPDIDKMFF